MTTKTLLVRALAVTIAIIILAGAIFTAGVVTKARVKSFGAHAQSAEMLTSARGMCTVEAGTGRILYEHNADAQLPMASTTKVVTAIAVLENCEDIDSPITIDPRAVGIEGTSIYLKKGETLTVRELLLGLMLRSGNDCAVALALHISPSVEDFNAKMQEVATRAGATQSSFKNPHGLDQEGHYTTARDLALISAYAMRNSTFAEIVGTKTARINGAEYPRMMRNKNRLLHSMDTCVGIKTGFTKKAGRCYVGAATKNGMTVVCAVLNCGPMFPESAAIMERADREFTMTRVLAKDDLMECGIIRADYYYPLRAGEVPEITCQDGNVCVRINGEIVHCAPINVIY